MQSELRSISSRASSESICLRYLRTETKYPPNYSQIENKPSQNRYNIKQYHDILHQENFIDNSDERCEGLHERIREKLCCDKSTYCRPVLNLYSQEYLLKTMEKNAKLRKLVTELVMARQKEKEMENWNKYINDLRKKHCTGKINRATSSFLSYSTVVDNSNLKHTNPCQYLLQDFYKPYGFGPPLDYHYYNTTNGSGRKQGACDPFKTNLLCYPTSSQGRLIMLERERIKHLGNSSIKPLFKTIIEEDKIEKEGSNTTSRKRLGPKKKYVICNSRSTNTTLGCTWTQTEVPVTLLGHFSQKCENNVDEVPTKKCNTKKYVHKEGQIKEMRNKETETPGYVNQTNNNLEKTSLVCIEEKLDSLIQSINSFIIEMKTKRAQNKCFDKYPKLGKKNMTYTRSDSSSTTRKERNVFGFIDDSSRTTRNSSTDDFQNNLCTDDNFTTINNILVKEIGENKLITLKGAPPVRERCYPCSVQISVTIPTKEISTEVTRSFYTAGNVDKNDIDLEKVSIYENRRIAIAVNTDPLGLLATLRAFTEETLKNLLSYMPTIDYYSYLSKLQGPPPKVVESHYVCNICGAAFTKPSTLTDHIQKHELGMKRDCCICRHVLDFPRRRTGLFKCQYCGQRFTRAYCCELHQEKCARQLGKEHDVTRSMMLLT